MKKCVCMMIAAGLVMAGTVSGDAQIEPAPKVRVLKSNVNLRAKPNIHSETVGQVSEKDELLAIRFTNEWVEIVPPQSIDLWVLGDYVNGGVIAGDNVNVRAGAGINFNIVGRLAKGENVTVRGEKGLWVSIAPPEKSSLWIHSVLVEVIPVPPEEEEAESVEKDGSVEVVEGGQGDPVTGHVEMEDSEGTGTDLAVPPPADLDLVESPYQGQRRQYEGLLRPRSFLARSPSKYRLIAYDERNRAVTLCFIKGNEVQLKSLLNRHMVVTGRVYWVRRSEYPVLVPDRIILKAQ